MSNRCAICRVEMDEDDWGHNAWPIVDGQCCDKCQNDCVLPARIANYYLQELKRKEAST
jgi:hypothetical protein